MDPEEYVPCLDVANFGTAGTVAVSLVPLMVVSGSVSLFLRWQFAAALALPAARFIPDLEAKDIPASRIKCAMQQFSHFFSASIQFGEIGFNARV